MENTNFQQALIDNIKKSYFNYYVDNFDYWYYEADRGKPYKKRFRHYLRSFRKNTQLWLKKLIYSDKKLEQVLSNELNLVKDYDYQYLYDALKNEEDKNLLVQIVTYRILGPEKVILKDIKQYKKNIEKTKQYFDFNDYIQVSSEDDYKHYMSYFDMSKYNNRMEGYKIYSTPLAYSAFLYEEQYAYKDIVKVEKGDYVLDCGAYDLNTSLYFANLAGENGKVFAVEFIDENLVMCEKNLALNPQYKDLIEYVKFPMAEKSGMELNFTNNSSCSKLIENNDTADCKKYISKSIDDFVKENNIKKIDFIKMDIEGSELSALKGAEETIKKFRPKLAISLYHKPEDINEIPKFIKSMTPPPPDYELYLKHVGVVDSEFVLFAK